MYILPFRENLSAARTTDDSTTVYDFNVGKDYINCSEKEKGRRREWKKNFVFE